MAACRSRSATFLALGVFALGASGCLRLSLAMQYEDSRRLQLEARRSVAVRPVAQVDTRLYGFILFGNLISRPDPEGLRSEYLTDPSRRITNWQIIGSSIDIPYLDFIFVIPTAHVIFDVVEVVDAAP